MNKLVARQRLVMTFTFFSMFFGAGNLIFPPFVGAQAGSATIPAAIGFIVSAVGLPILGVLAVTFALHLLLRAQWIALVGMDSVYPQGVRLDKLRMGPIQRGTCAAQAS